jgi:hypothetical protein
MLFEHSLRHYMTERSIVFGNDVIDLHLRMPLAVRCDNSTWLRAMALLNRKVARVANANTGYSPTMPDAVVSGIGAAKSMLHHLPLVWRLAKKGSDDVVPSGFSPISWPRFDWLIRNNAKLRRLIVETLGDDAALPPTLFDRDRVHTLLADHLADRGNYRNILFVLLTFGLWHRKHAGS